MANLQRQQQATDMIEVIKPMSHNDDEAFVKMLLEFAKRHEDDEEISFLLKTAADKIAMWKEHCEAVQADFERAERQWDKAERY